MRLRSASSGTFRRITLFALVALLAVPAADEASAKASLAKCQQKVSKATEKLRSQTAKALAKCVATVRKESARHGGATQKAADKCEKSLAKIYNVGGRQGKGAINKATQSITKLFRPGRATCTSEHLETLGLLESQRNAPGFAKQDFFAAALAMRAIDLALRETYAVSASTRAALDSVVALTDCGGANASTGSKQCADAGDPAPCCVRKGRGSCRPNLCTFATAQSPDCRTHACTLSSASGVRLEPSGVGLAFNGRALALTTCRAPLHADALPVDFAEENRLVLLETAQTLTPPPSVPGSDEVVCIELLRGQGWCDCFGSNLPFEPSSCRDHVVNDDLGSCAEGVCAGGSAGNGDVGESCTTDGECDGGAGRCAIAACRTDQDCGKRGLCTDLPGGICRDSGTACSDSTNCSGRREVCVASDDCGARIADAERESGCDVAGERPCHPGTFNGATTHAWDGASQAGDCALLATFSLSILPPALCVDAADTGVGACTTPCAGPGDCAADAACLALGGSACAAARGADGVACTADDRPRRHTSVQVPFTTGLATTTIATAIAAGSAGACEPGAANAGSPCVSDADCVAADPNAPPPACTGVTPADQLSTVTGAGVACTHLDAGSLAGMRLVGGFPWLDTAITGDAVTEIVLECQ